MGIFDGAEVIYSYTREQAIEDGVLVDVSEWASDGPDGMIGGFQRGASVVFTSAVWADCQPPARNKIESARGRAHDVLWMAICSAKSYAGEVGAAGSDPLPDPLSLAFAVRIGGRNRRMKLVWTLAEGFTIGYPEDF
jgi:hypothetical protein